MESTTTAVNLNGVTITVITSPLIPSESPTNGEIRMTHTQRVRTIPHDGSAPQVTVRKYWRDASGNLIRILEEQVEE